MDGINAYWPGLQPRELTQHFFRLWSEGFIDCAEGEDEPAIAPDFELARQQFELENPCRIGPRVFHLLTGCRRKAETFGRTMPEWIGPKFCSWYSSGPKEWTMVASVREPIEIALPLRQIAPLPTPGTERWDALQPWQAIYWKVLPIGHRLMYSYESWAREPKLNNEEEFRREEQLWRDFAGVVGTRASKKYAGNTSGKPRRQFCPKKYYSTSTVTYGTREKRIGGWLRRTPKSRRRKFAHFARYALGGRSPMGWWK
jgi:hypothetical protein